MDIKDAKQIIKNKLENYLAEKGINTEKPFRCLNPFHNDVHPSMSYDKHRNRVHCFACGVNYDMFDVIGIDFGLTSKKDAFKKAFDYFGLLEEKTQSKQIYAQKFLTEKKDSLLPGIPKADCTAYFHETRKHIHETDYPSSRGLSQQTIARYGLGFDEHFNSGSGVWKALIIPTGKSSFVARNTDPAAGKHDRIRKHGSSRIYNLKPAFSAEKPIFIVEGEMDALSVIEAGGNALALGGVANYPHLIEHIKKTCAPSQPMIICLDNDAAGEDASEKLLEALQGVGARAYRYNIAQGYNDASEAIMARRNDFIKWVAEAADIEQAQMRENAAEYKKNSASGFLSEFISGIAKSVDTPYISTGFDKLDKALDGGLYEGLYIVGAISSLGKTTLVTQIADQIANDGNDVVIFSLEMSKYELIAKSISRSTLLECVDNNIPSTKAKTTRGITSGKRYAHYAQDEIQLIDAAIKRYGEYADNIYINEGIGDIGVSRIREITEKHITYTGKKPVLIIDYLQILAPHSEKSTDKQNTDRAVMELKRISRDFKIPVIGISSFNRQSYREAVTMEAFKESGAIEYSSDVLIGLQLKGAGQKDFDSYAEKIKNPRQIELIILKNRNGATGVAIQFNYYPMFNYFRQEAL